VRAARAAVVVRLAAAVALRAWLSARLARGRDAEARRRAEERVWADAGRRLALAATRLGGLLIKVGQFLSTRVDLFPEAFTVPLAGLRDVVPAAPWPQVRARLEEAYGPVAAWPFGAVDERPLAAASLAQVHRARLRDGRSVVLKVLRPGIESLVETDLATVTRILTWAGRHTAWGRRYDLGAIAREFSAVTRQELDMPGEGERAERFRAMFADDPRVRAPAALPDLTRPGVLVLEEVGGMPPQAEALRAAGVDPAAVADLLLESYMRQWLSEGLFHADPHAGNLFVQADGAVTYVDFGMMAEIGPEDRAHLRDLVLSLVARDAEGAADALDALGFLRPGVDRRPLERALAYLLGRLFDPAGAAMAARETAEVEAILAEMRAFLHTHPFQIPARYAFLGRALGMLAGLTAALAPDRPFLPALARAARAEMARSRRRSSPGWDGRWALRAALAWARGDQEALAGAMERLWPAWRRAVREAVALWRLARRLARGEIVLSPPPAPPSPGERRTAAALVAAGAGVAAAVVGAGAPWARDLLGLAAVALALWALRP
jgi:predicted unusual protein kinase regulating ubiquinone biosynthesis (AarF/ABC1/UbiB family)